MSDTEFSKALHPGKPAHYCISVEGSLDEAWSGRLGGMQIKTRPRGQRKPITTLFGSVRDQAALFGVLESLYELHLPILKVELQDNGESANEERD